jgi:type IV pilus assembly protein PilA
MFNSRKRRSGFTLPEVLVTVAIVAVLAAIVVPTVTSQIGKGDDSRVSTSLTNVRTGITAFVSDTRKFPGRVSDLFNAIEDTDNDIKGSPYGTAAEARWKGPYASGSLGDADSLDISLGFIRSALVDSAFPSGTGYLIASIAGVADSARAMHIDSLIDGATGGGAGSLRWSYATQPAVLDSTLKFILMGSR